MNRKIAKNSIYNVIYKVFSVLFPLATTSYVSRILLAEGVGKVAYAQTIVTYFVTLAALGIPQYGIKAIAQSGDVSCERSKTFSELFIINLISTLSWILVYYIFVNSNYYFADRKTLFNVMGVLLILNIINVDWFFQGIEKYSYIATRSIIVKLLSLALMFIFVKTSDDFVIYGLILCLATAGNYLFNIYNIHNYVRLQINGIELRKHLKAILVLLASAVATEIYTMLDTVMIEYFHGEIYVGYYSNVVKVVRVLYTMVIAMVSTFYPQISKYLNENKPDESNRLLTVGIKIIMMVAFPVSVGMLVLADSGVLILLGKDFYPSITTLRILSILVPVFSFAYFLGHIILMSTGNENKILLSTIAGAILNCCLNLLLIPSLKHNGAAIASVASEILVTCVLIYYARNYFSLTIDEKYVKSIMLSLIIMTVGVVSVSLLFTNPILKGIIGSCLGVFLYGIGLCITKNEMVVHVFEMIQRHRNRS